MAPGWRGGHLLAGFLALAGSSPAWADERFDHRGSVGLLLAGGVEHKESAISGRIFESGQRADVDLGGTIAIGHDGNELKAFGRASLGGPSIDWSLAAGYRGYFGHGRFKTFFDLDAAAHLTPQLTFGPRVGFGLQYELSPLAGIFTGLAAQLGFGGALRFDAELIVGLQFRSYLLE